MKKHFCCLVACLFASIIVCSGQKTVTKRQYIMQNPWQGSNFKVVFNEPKHQTKPVEAEATVASEEGSEEVETSGSDEEVLNSEKSIVSKTAPAVVPPAAVSDPQKILSPWPGMEDQGESSRPVKQREAAKPNWYVYQNKQKGRYFGSGEDSLGPAGGKGGAGGGAGEAGKGGAGAGSKGGGGGGKGKEIDRNLKSPYGVVRIKPNQVVDPSGYNFFQLHARPKLGSLWISKKLKGRTDLGDDDGADIDDLDPANQYDWQFRRYDRACLYIEYKKKKTNVKIPPVEEELKRLVDNQNELLARRFLQWQFVGQDPPQFTALGDKETEHPHYYTYKFLQGTVEFFMERICKNSSNYVVAAVATVNARMSQPAQVTASNSNSSFLSDQRNFLPAWFTENIFNLFLVLRNLTVSEHGKDYATKEDDENIFEKILKECENEEQPHWYHHSCGDQVLSLDNFNNYACLPFSDYTFNPKLYDPILDSIWHMFNAVHAFCFKQFQANLRMWHKYAMIIANAYTPQMRLRWKASVASERFYRRLLGPDYETHLDQISRCTFGTVLRSNVPMLLPRFDTPSVTSFGPAD